MKAPNGTELQGTFERVYGSAGITWNNDGTYEHSGSGTEVFWDDMLTVTRGGEDVFVDEDGNEWLRSELIADDAEPSATINVPAWHRDETKREIEIHQRLVTLFADISDRHDHGDAITMATDFILGATR